MTETDDRPSDAGAPDAAAPTREFHFFPRFYISSVFFALFSIGLVLVVWLPLIYLYLYSGVLYGPIVRATLYLTATFLLFVMLGRIGKRELDKVRFTVSPEGVARRSPYRTIALAWGDIASVRCRNIPFVKGFVELSGPRGKLLLPSTITGFALLGRAFAEGLERAGKGNLCDETALRRIAAMALVSEAWNERARVALWPLTAATIGAVLFNALTAGRVWGAGPVPLFLWASMGLPMPLLAYGIADIRLNRRLEKALLKNERYDAKSDFRSEVLFGSLVVALAYGVLGIILKPIFLP